MKNSRKLIAIATTAILVLAGGSANAAPDARILTDSGEPYPCNKIWFKAAHNYGDSSYNKGYTKGRTYSLAVYTQTWLGSSDSQYGCRNQPVRMLFSEQNGKMYTDNGLMRHIKSNVRYYTSNHYTHSGNYNRDRGRAHKCSRSNSFFTLQGISGRQHSTWRRGPAIC